MTAETNGKNESKKRQWKKNKDRKTQPCKNIFVSVFQWNSDDLNTLQWERIFLDSKDPFECIRSICERYYHINGVGDASFPYDGNRDPGVIKILQETEMANHSDLFLFASY